MILKDIKTLFYIFKNLLNQQEMKKKKKIIKMII